MKNKKSKTHEYKKDTKNLREILNEWDFIGVFSIDKNWPKDEYDCLVDPLLSNLSKGSSVEKIGIYLQNELKNHFGIECDQEETTKIAEKIVNWWENK